VNKVVKDMHLEVKSKKIIDCIIMRWKNNRVDMLGNRN